MEEKNIRNFTDARDRKSVQRIRVRKIFEVDTNLTLRELLGKRNPNFEIFQNKLSVHASCEIQ